MSVDSILPAIVEHLIGEIPFRAYKRGGTGVTRNLKKGDTVILKKDPRYSYCCGATLELLWGLLESFGKIEQLSVQELEKLYHWTYILKHKGAPMGGVGQAIVDFGWGSSVSCEDAGYGCFAQMWDYKRSKAVFGHSIVVVGQTKNKSGKPAIRCWSSDPKGNHGHGYDYWSYKNPWSRVRKWNIARLSSEWLTSHMSQREIDELIARWS